MSTRDKILAILGQAEKPLTVGEIRARMPGQKLAAAALSNLQRLGTIVRHEGSHARDSRYSLGGTDTKPAPIVRKVPDGPPLVPFTALITHRKEIQIAKNGSATTLTPAEAVELYRFLDQVEPMITAAAEEAEA